MKSFRILILSFLLFAYLTGSAFCQDITLSWDPSPTPEVTGYHVYYKQGDMNFPLDGVGAAQGASPVDVGNVLTTTLTGLTDNTTYYFSVTAYNAAAESSYSNIVSNQWMPELLTPANGAVNEPIPVTFQWGTAPTDLNVTYTLYYGTDPALTAVASPSGNQVSPSEFKLMPPSPLIFFSVLFLMGVLWLSPRAKNRYGCGALILCTGLILTACSGGGGGDSTPSKSVAQAPTKSTTVYSIDKGTSDYHQAYDLEAGTTYYWKVVATDVSDSSVTYTSDIHQFTTENL